MSDLNAGSRSLNPTKSEYVTDASSILDTCETPILRGVPELKETNAPSPLEAYQRRESAGELATPTTTSS